MNSGNHIDALQTVVGFVEAVAPHEAHPVWSALEQLEAVAWTISDEESAASAELAELYIEHLRAILADHGICAGCGICLHEIVPPATAPVHESDCPFIPAPGGSV